MLNALWKPLAWLLARPVIANWLVTRAMRTPDEHIRSADGTEVYMRRFWVFNPYADASRRRRRHAWCPLSVRLHHIMRADEDRHLHDHPWNFRTIVLMGGYIERRDGHTHVRKRGSTTTLKFGEFHRITDVDRRMGAVTLFFMWRWRGEWGFKIPQREYLDQRR